MNPYMIQELARVQIAEQLRHADHARLAAQVRAARSPRRLVAGRRFPWLSPWFSIPRTPRAV